MLNRLRKYLLDKLPDLIPLLWAAPALSVLSLWEDRLLQATILKIQPVWQLRLLVLLSTICLALLTYNFLHRSKYTEYRGAYFKPKKGGGYHQVVYCGSCKTPTSYDGDIQFIDKKFKCKCGWVSSFNLGEFNAFYPSL